MPVDGHSRERSSVARSPRTWGVGQHRLKRERNASASPRIRSSRSCGRESHPGIRVSLTNPAPFASARPGRNGRGGEGNYQIRAGPRHRRALSRRAAVQANLREIRGSGRESDLRCALTVERRSRPRAIAALGLTVDQSSRLSPPTAPGRYQIRARRRISVMMGLASGVQRDPALSMLYVQAAALVPLSSVVTTRRKRWVRSRSTTRSCRRSRSFNLVPGVALGDARACRRWRARRCPRRSPPRRKARRRRSRNRCAASAGFSRRHLRHHIVPRNPLRELHPPITILQDFPSAGFGALLTLLQAGFDIYAFVSIIMLVGPSRRTHHDDRLRDRAPQRGHTPADAITGVSRALSADHDDDGGVDGHAVAWAGARAPRRAVRWPRGRRRPAGLADAYALRHAGVLRYMEHAGLAEAAQDGEAPGAAVAGHEHAAK